MPIRKLAGDTDAPVGDNKQEKQGINNTENNLNARETAITIQLEQFFTIFWEDTTAVILRNMRSENIKPKKAYHEFRQLLIYVEALHRMMYNDQLTEKIVDYFDSDAPIDVQPQDAHMYENYIKIFRQVIANIESDCSYPQQKIIESTIKQTARDIEHDYGYEAGLNI